MWIKITEEFKEKQQNQKGPEDDLKLHCFFRDYYSILILILIKIDQKLQSWHICRTFTMIYFCFFIYNAVSDNCNTWSQKLSADSVISMLTPATPVVSIVLSQQEHFGLIWEVSLFALYLHWISSHSPKTCIRAYLVIQQVWRQVCSFFVSLLKDC